jgi:hypothetical protein
MKTRFHNRSHYHYRDEAMNAWGDSKVFFEYCADFYLGDNAIYPIKNLTKPVLLSACNLVANRKDIDFDGDSIDRERVRELLESLGYENK